MIININPEFEEFRVCFFYGPGICFDFFYEYLCGSLLYLCANKIFLWLN